MSEFDWETLGKRDQAKIDTAKAEALESSRAEEELTAKDGKRRHEIQSAMLELQNRCNRIAGIYNKEISDPLKRLYVHSFDEGFKIYKGNGTVSAGFEVRNLRYLIVDTQQSPTKMSGGSRKFDIESLDSGVKFGKSGTSFQLIDMNDVVDETCNWVINAQDLG